MRKQSPHSRWLLLAGVLSLAVTAAYGQSMPAPIYAPQSPQMAFGGQPWGQPVSPEFISGPPMGNIQNVQYSQPSGDYIPEGIYDGTAPGEAGASPLPPTKPDWFRFREAQTGLFVNDEQNVLSAGGTLEAFASDRFAIASRLMMGAALNDHDSNNYHLAGDLYSASVLDGEHWIKGGVLWDIQENFHKVGPVVGALLFAEHKHPISLDIAYGLGYGDPLVKPGNGTILTIADDDFQLRAGTYLFPNLQVGFTGNWLNWTDGRFEDYNGYGGFASINFGTVTVNVDYTNGDDRERFFVNLAYTLGGRRPRPSWGDCGPLFVEHPRDWLTRTILRDTSLQLQRIRP